MDYLELLEAFKSWLINDKSAQALWNKVNNKKATYKDAKSYADRIGDEWARLLAEYGDNAIEHLDDISKCMLKAYSESAYYTKNLQKNLNEKANIGLKVIEPRIDETRISAMLKKIAEQNANWLLGSDVVQNIANAAVNDTIEANARFQNNAGLKTTMIRHIDGKCCDWCESISQGGKEFEYGEQPDDFFAMHKDCTCWIEYKTSKDTQKIVYSGGRKITSII